MKIKKLEIHNIASIEDATIDFTSAPLQGADIFLITGVTGSGKTTILDSICLALYRKIPRLAHLSSTTMQANSDALTQNDPRNMVRTHTGEAYVRLLFEGNDAHDYEAEWYVQRGKLKKQSSKFDNDVWSLHALKGEEKELIITGNKREGYTEVQNKIMEVVGLDFEQFCRTTLLAQGQFTKFLESTENEKSAILEKITGTGIYSKIGAAIYRIKADKEKAYGQLKADYEAIQVLSEEQRLRHEQELAQQLKDLETKTLEQDDLTARIGWIKIKQDDTARLSEASQRLAKAQTAIQSEQHLLNKATTEAWQETLNIRQTLRRQSEQQEADKRLHAEIEQLHDRYLQCMSGWAALQTAILAQQKRCKQLDTQLEAEKPLQETYEKFTDIYNALTSLHDKMGEREDKRKTLPQSEEQCRQLRKTQQEQQQDYEKVAKQAKDAYQLLIDQTAKLETIPHQQYRNLIDALNRLIPCNEEIKQYATRIEQQKRELQAIDLAPLTQELTALEQQLSEATKRREFCELTFTEAATMLRTHLHKHLGSDDCLCPVCKQRVDSLPEDALLSKTVLQVQQECQDLEDKRKQLEQRLNDLRLKQTGLKSNLERDEKSLNHHLSIKQDILCSLDDERRAQWADASKEQLTMHQEQLKQLLDQYDKECRQRDTYQRTYNENQRLADGHLKLLSETQQRLASCEASHKMTQQAIEEIDHSMQALYDQLRQQLQPLQVEENQWMEQPRRFAWELRDRRDAYLALRKEREDEYLKQVLSEQEHSTILTIYQEVRALRPSWGEEYGNHPMISSLQQEWMKLRADLDAAVKQEGEIRRVLMQCEREWDAFHQANAHYDLQRLIQLDSLTQDQYEHLAQEVLSCQTEHSTAKALYDESLTQLKEHEQDPKLHPASATEEDDEPLLAQRKDQLEQEKQVCMQRIVEYQNLLKQDDDNRLRKNNTEHLKEMYLELERWKQLCSIFGGTDAQGSLMRKIAQCFILSKLLDAANYHLKRMDDRFRLLLIEGTLDMKLEDRYNSYATRTVHGISGGESFMVSLSLALALADFGQGMGVETLFIDEGFGTLSGGPLLSAISVLQSLHSNTNRQVGIISHREEIREHIPVQICVDKLGNSSASRIKVVDRSQEE